MSNVYEDDGKFYLLGNRYLIELEKPKEKTEGGIIKPDIVKAKEQGWASKGILRAIGDKVKHSDFKIGDKLIFGKYYGVDLSLNGKRFRLMRPEDIKGSIETLDKDGKVCYNIMPYGSNVLIKPKKEEVTESGIIIQRMWYHKTNEGTVVKSAVEELKENDKVLFNEKAFIEVDGLYILDIEDIWGVLE